MIVVAYAPDMMDRTRINAVVAAAGATLRSVRSPGELVALEQVPGELVPGELVTRASEVLYLIDLGRPGVLEVLPGLAGLSTVGFVSHVDRDLARKARAAGCQRVLARSLFFRSLPALLSSR